MIQVGTLFDMGKILVVVDFSLLLSLCERCGNVENHGHRKRIRAEESERPLSFELVLKVALPPVDRVHLVQNRAYQKRIAARVRDSVAGLPKEGSHES